LVVAEKMLLSHQTGQRRYLRRRMMIDRPTSKSKAAGLRFSKELSSFSGLRHFWQYMLRQKVLELSHYLIRSHLRTSSKPVDFIMNSADIGAWPLMHLEMVGL
jgi:hypothetical protein